MKLLKSIAGRITALVLLFSMTLAVMLYRSGVYDISFIKRPSNLLPPESEYIGSIETDDPESGAPEVTLPNSSEEEIKQFLESIMSLEEMMSGGYGLSYDRFSERSALARVDFDFDQGPLNLRMQSISENVFYSLTSGQILTKEENKIVILPRIRLYFGYAFVDDGNTFDIYSPDGNKIVTGFLGSLENARSVDGKPVVKTGGAYYELDDIEGLVQITAEQVVRKAISFDYPRYYGRSTLDLHPLLMKVPVYTYVGDVETEAPETIAPETIAPETIAPETIAPETIAPETVVPETIAPETIAPETVTPETIAPETIAPETITPETVAPETAAPETAAPETIAPETVTPETAAPETVAPETIAPETEPPVTDASTEETAEETVSVEVSGELDENLAEQASETEPPETEIPEGSVIIQDGKYYEVSYDYLYGYVNSKGDVVLEPKYAMAYGFTSDGYACVISPDGHLYYINGTGKEVVSIRKTPNIYLEEFSYRRRIQRYCSGINDTVSDLGMYYYQDGYAMIRYCIFDPFKGELLYKNTNVLVDEKGKTLEIPGNYELKNYSDGIMLLHKNGKYGYMNTDRSWVSPAIFEDARPFIQGLAVAETDGNYGVIDTEGNVVLPFTFDYISDVSDGRIAAYSAEYGWQIYTIVTK